MQMDLYNHICNCTQENLLLEVLYHHRNGKWQDATNNPEMPTCCKLEFFDMPKIYQVQIKLEKRAVGVALRPPLLVIIDKINFPRME